MLKTTDFKKYLVPVAFTTIFLIIFLDLPFICQTHSHDETAAFKYSKEANAPKTKPERALGSIWLYAITSTILISIAPFLLLYFIPIDGTEQKKPLLKVLLAFASGGLLGDAFLHLIPHANVARGDAGHTHSHSHSHSPGEHGGHDMSIGLWVLAGIVTFLAVEKGVRLIKGGHGHAHGPAKKAEKKEDGTTSTTSVKSDKSETKDPDNIKVSGYLNLAADFSHNFTDGLAIGASYLAGQSVGLVTTITILLHEVPHEIGDYAILIQSGCTRKKAMLLQLTTAVGALAGTVASMLTQTESEPTWILPFTAGGFIYIALVSVIPELLDDSKPVKLFQSVLEIAALLCGVYMMVLIAEYE